MWFKVDDGLHGHPKVLTAGNSALGLWARLGSYCGDQLTDGFVPEAVAKAYGTRGEIQRLLLVGMLEPAVHPLHGAGFELHDYLDFNPSRDDVLADRAKSAERQRRFKERHAEGNAVSNGSPTRPDPTRPARLTSVERQTTTRGGGSSSVDDVIKVAAAGIAIRTGHAPRGPYARGVEANLRDERLAELTELAGSSPLLEAVAEVVGSKVHARAAVSALNGDHA